MPKFRCEVKMMAFQDVEVTAENRKEAVIKAIEKAEQENAWKDRSIAVIFAEEIGE